MPQAAQTHHSPVVRTALAQGYAVSFSIFDHFKYNDAHVDEIEDQPLPDVVYVESAELWACCTISSQGIDCSNPSDETFNRPPPEDLITHFQIPATGYTYTPTSTSTPTTSSTTSISRVSSTSPASSSVLPTGNATPKSSGLSSGAMAGIAVAVAAVVIIVLTVLVLTWRARRRRTKEYGMSATSLNPMQYGERGDSMPTSQVYERGELAGDHTHQHQSYEHKELSAFSSPSELPA